MIKRYFLAGFLALFPLGTLFSSNLLDSSGFKKKTLHKTEIEFFYNHYIQDGNNSAVTGGIGTEKLIVYAPSLAFKNTRGKHSWSLKGGSDVISSASTDKIDYVKSSASILDTRTYLNITYQKTLKNEMKLDFGTGFSVESDYSSLPFLLGIRGISNNKMRNWNIEFRSYFDDLRWGRFNADYKKPVKLIYPSELRFKDWYETNKRNSFNLKGSLVQIINKRNVFGVFPSVTLQEGLLATPFHRVYFKDSSLKVENLPDIRKKISLGLKWNKFIGGRIILKNNVEFYGDDFGIVSLAFENETAIKMTQAHTLIPFFRLYFQEGSKYFAPYRMHDIIETFYTSDYDLSDFNSFKLGAEWKYAPYTQINKKLLFKQLTLRYSYYSRSNGLFAHIMSISFNLEHYNKKGK